MITVRLRDGRELGVEAVAPHEAMRLAEGTAALSGNRGWWDMAMVVAAIRTIKKPDEPKAVDNPFPTRKRHIEGLIARFDEDDIKRIRAASSVVPEGAAVEPIETRDLSPIEQLRLWEVAEDLGDIPAWIASAFMAARVRKIGDAEVEFPGSQEAVRELVKTLGITGMVKAAVAMIASKEARKAEKKARAAESAAKN